MKKVAIFVEGQTEQIFVGQLIHQIYGYQGVNLISEKIQGSSLFVKISQGFDPDFIDYLFLIVDVGTDDRVVSAILENAEGLAQKGFCKILGLRDLFPKKRSQKEAMLLAHQKALSSLTSADTTKVLLAVMEIEAWFLADPTLFSRIDASLTAENIKTALDVDLEKEDPEDAYEHPANIIKDIYQLAGMRYRKRADDIHKIAHNIDYNTLYLDAQEKGHIKSFALFVKELEELDVSQITHEEQATS